MKFLIRDVGRQAEEFLDGLYEAAELAAEEDGPQAYAPMLAEDIRAMEILKEAETYREIADGIAGLKFGRLAAVGENRWIREERAGRQRSEMPQRTASKR